jgi:hypothetical protein
MAEQQRDEADLDVCTVCGSVPVVTSRPLPPRLRGLGDGPDGMFLRLCASCAPDAPPRSTRSSRRYASTPPRDPWWTR